MNAKRLLTIAVAATVVLGRMVAAGAAVPADLGATLSGLLSEDADADATGTDAASEA
jgi:hypothetical protein